MTKRPAGNRTGDLSLTGRMLLRLSHKSRSVVNGVRIRLSQSILSPSLISHLTLTSYRTHSMHDLACTDCLMPLVIDHTSYKTCTMAMQVTTGSQYNRHNPHHNGGRAHYVIESKVQWKPFWLATQQYPQNDWLGGILPYTMTYAHGPHSRTVTMDNNFNRLFLDDGDVSSREGNGRMKEVCPFTGGLSYPKLVRTAIYLFMQRGKPHTI